MTTPSDVVQFVLTKTDFLGDIVDDTSVDQSLDLAVDNMEPLPSPEVLEAARGLLITARRRLLSQKAREALDFIADAREAGDIDENFHPIPYPMYRSV